MNQSYLKSIIKFVIREIVDIESSGLYKFHDFKWLADASGFNMPSDVFYGSTYIGTIKSNPHGYEIVLLDTQKGKKPIKSNKQNLFKTKNLAAEQLHQIWKFTRNKGIFQ